MRCFLSRTFLFFLDFFLCGSSPHTTSVATAGLGAHPIGVPSDIIIPHPSSNCNSFYKKSCTNIRPHLCAIFHLDTGPCARCTIPGSAEVKNLCNFPIDKSWGLWYNGKRLRASARRPLIITDLELFVNRQFCIKKELCNLHNSNY